MLETLQIKGVIAPFRKFAGMSDASKSFLPYLLLAILGVVLFQQPIQEYQISWLQTEIYHLTFSMKLDSLSGLMFIFVLFIGLNIYRYASRYLLSDPSQFRFQCQLIITVLSVELFVLSGNLLTAYIGWQLIGFNLYLLLNHYHYNSNANRSAKKKFIINRLGDMCFLSAVVLSYVYYNDSSFSIFLSESAYQFSILGFNCSLNGTILMLLFAAVLTKSAQFPFHIWLPDTMEAPTPVSALMHAGIINAGGILLAKSSAGLVQHPTVMLVILIVGMTTLLTGVLFKALQSDIKRRLAYSTMSQMGYMVMQVGMGFFSTAVFHLITHGLYKATLFLNSGNTLLVKNDFKTAPAKKSYFKNLISFSLSVGIITCSVSLASLLGLDLKTCLLLDVFMFISINEYIKNVLRKNTNAYFVLIHSLMMFFISFAYFYILNQFDKHIQIKQFSIDKNSIDILLSTLVLAIYLGTSMVMVGGLLKHDLFKKIMVLTYHKFYVEHFYRHVFIEPIRNLGIYANQLLASAVIKAFCFLAIIIVAGMLFVTENIKTSQSLITIIYVFMFCCYLVANKAKSLRNIIAYLALAQILMTLSLLYFNQDPHFIIYHLITTLLLLLSLGLNSNKTVLSKLSEAFQSNKLPLADSILVVGLFMLIGLPFTPSFISWFFLIKETILFSPILTVVLLLGNVMLSIAVLHTLQDYVFTTTKSLQNNSNTNLFKIIINITLLATNLLLGIFPWLLMGN